MGKPKLFSDEQENFILENYCTMSNKDLANILNVKRTQVNSWLQHRGINRNGAGGFYNQIFSEEDIEFIKNNYTTMTYSEIGNILGFTGKQIQGKINKLNLPRKNRIINDNYFESINTPLKAYILGFIYADGWVIYDEEKSNYEFGIMLQKSDKYVLEMIDNELGGTNLIIYNPPRVSIIEGKQAHSNEAYTLRVFSKKIVKDLISNGIEPNKSKKDIYPIVSTELFFDFLRGYVDGDGCFYNDRNYTYMHITSASISPLLYIQTELSKYDICTRIYTENDKKHRLMCVNTTEMNKLVNHLYYEDGLFCLKRKYEKIKHFISFAA